MTFILIWENVIACVRGDKHTEQYRYNYPYILVKKNCRFKWRTDAILDIV